MNTISRRAFILGGAAAVPYLYLERLSVAVRRHQVPVKNLPPSFHGFTVLQLTDLHDKEFGAAGEDLLRLLKSLRFDMVALTGDLVVGENPRLTPALDLVAGIAGFNRCPVYSVCGNHEYALGRAAEFNDRLAAAGVRTLSNGSTYLDRGKQRIWIVGVDDPVTGRDRLREALSATDSRSPRLMLVHAPHPFPQAVKAGVDLVLAGHTHGGQVRLPFLGAAYVPSMGYFPRYDYGLYRERASTMIVNGGLGESWAPVRFNIRPEVVLATLVPQEEVQVSPFYTVG